MTDYVSIGDYKMTGESRHGDDRYNLQAGSGVLSNEESAMTEPFSDNRWNIRSEAPTGGVARQRSTGSAAVRNITPTSKCDGRERSLKRTGGAPSRSAGER